RFLLVAFVPYATLFRSRAAAIARALRAGLGRDRRGPAARRRAPPLPRDRPGRGPAGGSPAVSLAAAFALPPRRHPDAGRALRPCLPGMRGRPVGAGAAMAAKDRRKFSLS